MAKVKICGITCEEDIKILNKYRPDYAGFVFAKSRRQITFNAAEKLAANLDDNIKKVGIFVNAFIEDVLLGTDIVKLDVIQLHGDEKPDYLDELRLRLKPGIEIWKAIRVKDENDILKIEKYSADRFLTDTYTEGVYGGGGEIFDWNLAASAKNPGDIILAGGLNTGNVIDAIRIVNPFGVDVSTGVETDGKKDEAKICDFIRSVRNECK